MLSQERHPLTILGTIWMIGIGSGTFFGVLLASLKLMGNPGAEHLAKLIFVVYFEMFQAALGIATIRAISACASAHLPFGSCVSKRGAPGGPGQLGTPEWDRPTTASRVSSLQLDPSRDLAYTCRHLLQLENGEGRVWAPVHRRWRHAPSARLPAELLLWLSHPHQLEPAHQELAQLPLRPPGCRKWPLSLPPQTDPAGAGHMALGHSKEPSSPRASA